jgi:hypothetical protein
LLLSIISSSILLKAQLVVDVHQIPNTPFVASLQMLASLGTIGIGVWEYFVGIRDLRYGRIKLLPVVSPNASESAEI